ncbi:PAS domain S-box protein [Rubellimicrobium arenae]|uniref:PAS domain S-box protein n=1 Tax=Rubellimicrobium arenae TaxID=2817372 RepID=UPI001B308BBD|nr:PAS domain S-box protein [Rubellimicrobium arenae]
MTDADAMHRTEAESAQGAAPPWPDRDLSSITGPWPPPLRAAAALAMASPQPMWLGWGDEAACLCNPACRTILGHHPEPGRPAGEVWAAAGDLRDLLAAARRGEARTETRVLPIDRGQGPEKVAVTFALGPVLQADGTACGFLCVATLGAEAVRLPGEEADAVLRAAAARKAFLADLSDALRDLDDPAAIACAASSRLGPHLNLARCGFAEADSPGEAVVVGGDWTDGSSSVTGVHRLDSFGAFVAGALRSGRPAVVRDVATDPRLDPAHRSAYGALGVRAHVATPVLRPRGLAAVLFVHSASPRNWSEDEADLLREVAERTCAAIEAARATRALRDSEAFIRDILQASNDCIEVLDLDGQLRFMSEGGQRVKEIGDFGRLAGESWVRLWPPAARRLAEAALATARSGGVGSFRAQAPTETGSPRFWDVVISPIMDPQGRSARLLAISRDITTQRHAEAALRESEARFRNMADSAPVMIWTTDAQGRCTYVNRRWREFTGRPPAEALGLGYLSAMHPDDVPPARDMIRTGQRPERAEYRLRRADGSWAWVLDAATARHSPEGAFMGYIGSVADITDRKLAEERRALLVNELNHRVKNTLATVQSLAAQSFRLGQVDRAVRKAFEARLMSLARAHDVLTQQSWEGARLDDLARRALTPFSTDPARLSLRGPALWLPPRIVLALAMAFHELATNAAKYGALSGPDGHVDLSWEATRMAGERRLRLVWAESRGPSVEPPTRQGFGSRLIEHGLANELGGEVEIDYCASGVICRLDAPLPTEGNE